MDPKTVLIVTKAGDQADGETYQDIAKIIKAMLTNHRIADETAVVAKLVDSVSAV